MGENGLIVLALEHRSDDFSRDYPEFIGNCLDEAYHENQVDVLVGPDYALRKYKDRENYIIDFDHTIDLSERIRLLSKKYPKLLLLPGTGPKRLNRGLMGLCSPAFLNGDLIREFYKETDYEESNIAKLNKLEYFRGKSHENALEFKDKLISVQICSDTGKQRTNEGTFLEVIMTYDENAGFHIRADNKHFDRYALVCDGLKGFAEGFEFNTQKSHPLRFIEPISTHNKLKLFKFT